MRARHGRNTLAVGIVLAGLLTGCGEDDGTSTPTGPTTVTVPSNRAPQITESIPDTSMFIGQNVHLDMQGYFSDPDGDTLTYDVTSSSAQVAMVSVAGSTVTLSAMESGMADITVAARDPAGLTAEQSFSVTAEQGFASIIPLAPRFGPTEAGKRSRDPVIVTVADASGAPLGGVRWRFETDDHSGWVYPAQGTTGADGRISATWVAGTPGAGILTLTAEKAGSSMTTELATESIASRRPPDGATAVGMDHAGRANGYSIDLTPLSEPTGTYYAAIQWDGGYTGLQRGGSRYDYQLQFSVWDAPGGGDAQVVERGDGVICIPFGGEGTGQKCELNYPWRVGATYRFEVTEEDLDGGSAMTLHVTDLAAGRRRFVGTLRYAARANLRNFAMFVEDFVHRAPTCLEKDVRSAAIRRALARVGGSWRSITRGSVHRYQEDSKNPGTPACANRAARNHAAGLEMVIGGRTASDPDAPNSVAVP